MTIAIGLLTEDGIIMAADTEESTATQKADVSKFIWCSDGTSPHNMIVSGAGPDFHIESIAELMRDEFSQVSSTASIDLVALKQRLRTCLSDYYRDRVLCWPSAGEREDNDFVLLVGVTSRTGENALWVTRQNTLRDVYKYSAVGIGAQYAKVLLKQKIVDTPRKSSAIPIAIDVARLVKRDIPGCGKDTEVVLLVGGSTCMWNVGVASKGEEFFEQFDLLTQIQFDSLVSDDYREIHDKELAEMPAKLKRLRAEFREWLRPMQLQWPITATPSTPRKSKDRR
jgi:20S proteasome alpha/beta subunit